MRGITIFPRILLILRAILTKYFNDIQAKIEFYVMEFILLLHFNDAFHNFILTFRNI